MKFESRKFSKRFPPVECAIFVVHEPFEAKRYETTTGVVYQYRGTAAAIILPDGRFWVGATLCSPRDQFVKKIGRAKAIGRAFVAMIECTEIRDGAPMPVAHGVIEFQNNGEEAQLAGTDWAGILKTTLRVEINEMKIEKGIV